jgi:hypothetical protein
MTKFADKSEGEQIWYGIRWAGFAAIGLICLMMWGCPTYSVWQQGLVGQAALARAEQDRQIRVQEAEAHRDSAVYLAAAEVLRAEGVAEANEIVQDGLGGPEGYLRYLFIQALENNDQDLIYVPTEANLPILEATRTIAPR